MIRKRMGRRYRVLRNRINGFGGVILMYHRVADAATDPWGLSVRPDRFAEHLELIRQHATPVRLQDYVNLAFENARSVRNVVAITFDDGYLDNATTALPILERYAVPATIFIATGFVDQGEPYWWDELEFLLLHPGTRPRVLRLSCGSIRLDWDLAEDATYDEADFTQHRSWRAEQAPPTSRHALFLALWSQLVRASVDEQRRVLQQLRDWAGVIPTSDRVGRCMTSGELADVAVNPLIEVGAHTESHPQLSGLPAAEQRREIVASRTALERIVGRPPLSFSFPHGSYTDESVRCVYEAGFRVACRTAGGPHDLQSAWKAPRVLELPRMPVDDWDGDTFRRRLLSGFEQS